MRTVKLFIVAAYLVGAVLTFDFAIPVDCKGVKTGSELWACARHSIVASAAAGAIWPAYWAQRLDPR